MPQSYGTEEACHSTEGGSSAPVFASSNCIRRHSASPATPPPLLSSVPKEVIISFVWDDGALPLAIPVNQRIGMSVYNCMKCIKHILYSNILVSLMHIVESVAFDRWLYINPMDNNEGTLGHQCSGE